MILDAAVEIFGSRPYEEIHVDEICDQAGVASHGLLAYHFNGKRGLYVQALQQIWTEFLEYQAPRSDDIGTEGRLREFMQRHFEFIDENPQRFLSLVRPSQSDPEVRALFEEARREAVLQILGILELPAEQPPRLRAALRGIVGYFTELTLDWLAHRDLEVKEVADLGFDALVSALRDAGEGRAEVERALVELGAAPVA